MSADDAPGGRARRRRERVASRAERDLWQQVMRDATPMRHSKRAPVDVPDASPDETAAQVRGEHAPASPPQKKPAKAPPRPQPTPPIQPTKAPDPGVTPGRLHNVDRRTADRLKRGRLEIEGRIDLHGMTRAAAQDALTSFVVAAADRGQRCVLVITGKGTFSGGPGVLKQEVPKWLNMPPLRERIVAVNEAQPKHGGGGALYVLLKRKRG
ncbi:MAG: Smr/MutS family protein [Rhodovibrio sp.]|nr:Smr/MutS family protein [Rhodovibrio sp.]